MKVLLKILAVFAIVLGVYSCAPTRFIEPLEPGQSAITGTLGGPLLKSGSIIGPAPLTSIAYGRGIDSNLTVYAGVHTTAALFGNLQTDVGITYRLLKQNLYIPSISVSPAINSILDFKDKEGRIWPKADANLYWNFGEKKHVVYVGSTVWFSLNKYTANDVLNENRVVPNAQLGLIWKGKKWQYGLETKLVHPSYNTERTFIVYPSVFEDKGGIGIYLSFTRAF
jgi:hypothetical protein